MAGVPAADGNVTAYADTNGDLWVFGDALANRVSVRAKHEDSYTVAGLDATTTVNGQASVTLVAQGTRMVLVLGGGDNEAWLDTDHGSFPVHVFTTIVVIGGSGSAWVSMVGPVPETTADLGPGDDFVWIREATGGLHGSLLMGDGDDVIAVDAFTGIQGSADLGPEDDRLEVAQGSPLTGRFELGAGDDFLSIVEGSGAFDLDDDDDRLELEDVDVGAARFDGGPGTDTYRDLGVEFQGFEFPQGWLGPALDVPTTITGRVVVEDGAPVPGAVVLLPALDRATLTDADGRFQFETIVDERKALEVTIGARVRGRARSGADGPLGENSTAEALVNELVIGAVTRTPNVLRTFSRSAFGRFIQGAAARNVLVSIVPSGDVAGTVWDSSDLIGERGRVVLLANSTWIQAGESLDVIENLQAFLQREEDGLLAR